MNDRQVPDGANESPEKVHPQMGNMDERYVHRP